METRYARLCRLERLDREHRRAIHEWHHAANVEWAATRDIAGSRSLREWCWHLERMTRDFRSQNRRLAADVAEWRDEADDAEQADAGRPVVDLPAGEPPVIRRRGEGGKPHAK